MWSGGRGYMAELSASAFAPAEAGVGAGSAGASRAVIRAVIAGLRASGGGGQLLQELARGDGRGGVCAAVRGPRLGLEGRGSRLRSVTVPCESHKEPSRTGRGGGG